MCREQLPVWQSLYETYKDKGVEIVTVAMDAQGADLARPYVEKAGATYPALIDEANVLGQVLGFRAIPNGVLIDEQGSIRYTRFGGFDIHHAETKRLVEGWFNGAPLGAEPSADGPVSLDQEALAAFDRGLVLYREGKTKEAALQWRIAVQHDPKNLVIRKQLWALEHPEKFYAGDVDYAWQREQMEKGL